MARSGSGRAGPEVNERLSALAASWSSEEEAAKLDRAAVIEAAFTEHLLDGSRGLRRATTQLEQSGFFEAVLWPAFEGETATTNHVVAIARLLLQKGFSEGNAWPAEAALGDHDKLAAFVHRVALLLLNDPVEAPDVSAAARAATPKEAAVLAELLILAFASLDRSPLRKVLLPLASIHMWLSARPGSVALQLAQVPRLRTFWAQLLRQAGDAATPLPIDADTGRTTLPPPPGTGPLGEGAAAVASHLQRFFLPGLVERTLSLSSGSGANKASPVLGRLMELLSDLLLQLPTRRFLLLILRDRHAELRLTGSGGEQAEEAAKEAEGAGSTLFRLQRERLVTAVAFPVNEHTGAPRTVDECKAEQYRRLRLLQRLAYKEHGDTLKEMCLAPVGAVSTPEQLRRHLTKLSPEQRRQLANRLQLTAGTATAAAGGGAVAEADATDMALELLLRWHAPPADVLRAVNAAPLYPDEALMWDPNRIPTGRFEGGRTLALPKLGLQFLSLHDYLLRSWELFRIESAYEVRADLVDALRRCDPRRDAEVNRKGNTVALTRFAGWSRMALPVEGSKVSRVRAPKIGQDHPSAVLGEVSVDLGAFAPGIRAEWDNLRSQDSVFLLVVHAPTPELVAELPALARRAGGKAGGGRAREEEDPHFAQRRGVLAVRGAEVVSVLDEAGDVVNDRSELPPGQDPPRPKGTKRTFRLRFDAAQYHLDISGGAVLRNAAPGASADVSQEVPAAAVYDSFNLMVRRQGKENNFKAVLETMRDVMNSDATQAVVPAWMQSVLLGSGDPAAAHHSRLAPPNGQPLDMNDTFVNGQHAAEALSAAGAGAVRVLNEDGEELAVDAARQALLPPFRVTFPRAGSSDAIVVQRYRPRLPGPFPEDEPRRNPIPFTATQISAIRGGMNPGLSLIVGPPGTGKTDVAVQIVANLYRAFPTERVLVVTHSNQALNDLFRKVTERDVDERHLLRLGRGESELATDGDFSKWGRVEYTLRRRQQLLAEVSRLAATLGLSGDVGYTCETAGHFYRHHVLSRVEAFEAALRSEAGPELAAGVAAAGDVDRAAEEDLEEAAPATAAAAAAASFAARRVLELFPFGSFFATAPGGLAPPEHLEAVGLARPGQAAAAAAPGSSPEPVFGCQDAALDVLAAKGCLRHLRRVFEELASFRAVELLRTQRQRTDYMLVHQARVIAMTCTHAAITRQHLLDLRFKYDTVVMEESAQVTEAETFLPLVLQGTAGDKSRLKRVILIGDHNQLPPVVRNTALQTFSRLDQSMFTRLLRLGVPHVQLDLQGRARKELAELYRWRYSELGDLPRVTTERQYLLANAGFALPYQFVDVPDYLGRGESSPRPYYIQNLGEAEMVVGTFMFMRLLGYPAESIALLTTYNGQRDLIDDIVQQRCAPYPQFGRPRAVSTVDKYQGNQADYVLLSLVRTKDVGHIRDVRRLVVALSRARLGLYVFGRRSTFAACRELQPALAPMFARPAQLQLVSGETHPSTRSADAEVASHGVGSVEELGDVVSSMAELQYAASAPVENAAPSGAANGDSAATASSAEVAGKVEGGEAEEAGSGEADQGDCDTKMAEAE